MVVSSAGPALVRSRQGRGVRRRPPGLRHSCGAAWVAAFGDGRLARPSCGDGRLARTIARHVNGGSARGMFQASARSRPSTWLSPERMRTAASERAPRSPSPRHRGWRGGGVRTDLRRTTGCSRHVRSGPPGSARDVGHEGRPVTHARARVSAASCAPATASCARVRRELRACPPRPARVSAATCAPATSRRQHKRCRNGATLGEWHGRWPRDGSGGPGGHRD